MNKFWKFISIVGLLGLVFGAAGVAYAQIGSPQPYIDQRSGPGMMGGRGRGGGGMVLGEAGLYHESMVEIFASELGLSASQLEDRLENGETMWQIAEAQGMSLEEFSAVMLDARSAMLAKAVAEGTITREQADFMGSRVQASGGGFTPGSCMGDGYSSLQDFQRGRQGRWTTP